MGRRGLVGQISLMAPRVEGSKQPYSSSFFGNVPRANSSEEMRVERYRRSLYHKDTEPLYHSFMYSPTTSCQYLSILCNSFIACTIMSDIFNRQLIKEKSCGNHEPTQETSTAAHNQYQLKVNVNIQNTHI